MIEERFLLAKERIEEIREETGVEMRTLPMPDAFRDYFNRMAEFVLLTVDAYRYVETGRLYLAPLEELRERNYRLYEDILPENYDKSYGNPAYSVSRLGEEIGRAHV